MDNKLTLSREKSSPLLGLLCIFVELVLPIFYGNNQFLTGSIINCAIILAALNLNNYFILPIIVAPSIGMLIGSSLFNIRFSDMLYILPFIWFGNAILILLFKKLKSTKFPTKLILSATLKSAALLIPAFFLCKAGNLTHDTLHKMTLLPFLNVIIGGTIAYILGKTTK